MLGVLQYVQDYADRLPPLTSGGEYYGWADGIQPYVKSIQIFQCPSELIPGQSNPAKAEYSDYWFNSRLARSINTDFNFPATIITFGDGNDGSDITDARYNKSTLSSMWINSSTSPAQRHVAFRGGANYAFLDGHIKWLMPQAISDQPNAPATFSPR